MLKFTAKMTLVLAMLAAGACAYIPVNEDEPRAPSSIAERGESFTAPWHFPYYQKNGRFVPY